MNKEIAVFINKEGLTENLNEAGTIKIYKRENGVWLINNSFDFEIDQSGGMQSARASLEKLVKELEACKIIVANKISGLPYTILDRYGMHIWEIEGSPDGFLDEVLNKEDESEISTEETMDPRAFFEKSEDGIYFINLKAILMQNSQLTSKKVLKPFLVNETFYELRVVFSHIPPWLGQELKAMNLDMIIENKTENEVCMKIQPIVCGQ